MSSDRDAEISGFRSFEGERRGQKSPRLATLFPKQRTETPQPKRFVHIFGQKYAYRCILVPVGKKYEFLEVGSIFFWTFYEYTTSDVSVVLDEVPKTSQKGRGQVGVPAFPTSPVQ